RPLRHRAHHHPVRERSLPARRGDSLKRNGLLQRVWSRRPAKAVSRLGGRQLLVLSARDLLAAAAREELLLVAFYAPAPAAIAGAERVQREIEAGFTGVSITAADTQEDARDAALTATAVCQMELGLEIVPLGGARAAAELARQLRSRGAPPSAVRITGLEDEADALAADLRDIALSTAMESIALHLPPRGLRQLVASGPFLRALRRSVPREMWDQLQSWADENGATPEQAAARHQRMLRDLPAPIQSRLEALCCFEGLELLRASGCRATSARLIAAIAAAHEGGD